MKILHTCIHTYISPGVAMPPHQNVTAVYDIVVWMCTYPYTYIYIHTYISGGNAMLPHRNVTAVYDILILGLHISIHTYVQTYVLGGVAMPPHTNVTAVYDTLMFIYTYTCIHIYIRTS